ncbi:zinc transporter [Proteus mirabilis]|uniref:Zinc transporter n=1 Tax=Proteus mirabilis TaxID=584 RepID=A0A379GHY1_PROMI|nr:zinc transporter [Proteus mirabilis]
MKSVNNAIIEDSDAIYTAQLNGHGGIMPITANSIASNERPFWVHLDYRKTQK